MTRAARSGLEWKSIKWPVMCTSLALLLLLAGCGKDQPDESGSKDSSSRILEPITASSSPSPEPVKTSAPTASPAPAAPTAAVSSGQGAASASEPPKPETVIPSQPDSKPVASSGPTGAVAPVPAPTSAAEPKPDIAATPTPTAAPVISEPAKTSATPAASEPAKAVNASAQAEVLYKSSCVSCHGVELEGKSGPSLQQVGTRKTKEQIMTQINKGSSKMPGFENRLDQASVELLAVWLADKK